MLSTRTGVAFTNRLSSERYLTNQVYLNGSGVAVGDMDGDGLVDLYFCGLGGLSTLYRNRGDWKFDDVTGSAGVAVASLDATGAAFADVDGDGDLDLVVNTIRQGTHCFFNDGKGRFTEPGYSPALNPLKCGTTLALADIDGDGDLDLYVANYRTDTMRDQPNTRLQADRIDGRLVVLSVNGRPATEPDLVGRFTLAEGGKILEHGEADVLLRNDGGGKFTPIPFTEGAFTDEDGKPLKAPPYDWSLAAMFRDMNGDGAPDLYVCNDFESVDQVWINDGQGKFRALPRLALRHTSMFSMGVDFADLNRDGFDDFVVLDMLSPHHQKRHLQVGEIPPIIARIGAIEDRPQYSFNTVFANRGDGTYAEVAFLSGLEASEWSWTPVFLDVDLDGYEDLLITTGHELEMMNGDVIDLAERLKAKKKLSVSELLALRKLFPRLDSPNVAFRNRGDLTFEEVSGLWGFDARGVSHGMALGDLDGDGDLDVVMNNLNGAAGVYRNEGNAPRVAVRLKGLAPNTRGIGARIWVFGGAVAMQSQEMICGGRYLSSDDAMRVFAAGGLTNEMRIEVRWRSGRWSVVEGVKANRVYEIEEAAATEQVSSKSKAQSSREVPSSKVQAPSSREAPTSVHQPSTINHQQPMYEDVSGLISHTHHEEPFDDFQRQPLLPRKLSQLGPGVAWWDVDRDGWEDLILGSGKGGKLAVYRSAGKGKFSRMTNGVLEQAVTRDQTAVLGVGPGKILVGSANYEEGAAAAWSAREYDLGQGTGEDILPAAEWSVGPMVMGDMDGDGNLELIALGRVIGGRYPEAASSRVYRRENRNWVLDEPNSKVLEKTGLVSGAVLSDLDGDSLPELILACEWGPIRIFKNQRGHFAAWNVPVSINHEPSTINQLNGWWNGVTTGDFDGDGRLDIAASNWGSNTRYRCGLNQPIRIYYGDFDQNGQLDVIEAYFDNGSKRIVPGAALDEVSAALPFVREKFPTCRAYATAGVAEILGEQFQAAHELQAIWFQSAVLLNRGDRFEVKALPFEAQAAPAFGITVGDLDGDGREDLFLAQNFFGVELQTSRYDAGRGVWLKGDGRGNFTSTPGQESGVKVYGEQRGCAVCDYDRDGRVDLVVTQNAAETKLYHNIGAKPGLRVRLEGPAGNPTGAGAVVRLKFNDRYGPAREVHAGSGYWSQDGAVQVFGTPEPPAQIEVQWPGGGRMVYQVSPGVREIGLSVRGKTETLNY